MNIEPTQNIQKIPPLGAISDVEKQENVTENSVKEPNALSVTQDTETKRAWNEANNILQAIVSDKETNKCITKITQR